MIPRFRGNPPSNVRKDGRYSVVHGSDGMEVRLVYRLQTGEQALVTTASHPNLVEMVNHVKQSLGGVGGAFYINEYHQVLVPGGPSGEFFVAGEYRRYLEFELDGELLGPVPPDGLSPGELWPGPKVGIAYVLTADGCDVKYKAATGRNRLMEKRLSKEVGRSEALQLARRLGRHKQGGGRIYINEAQEFFAPVQISDEWHHVYLGGLEGSSWFPQAGIAEVRS